MTDFASADSARADVGGSTPSFDPGALQWSLAETLPCPGYRHDYVKLAAWLFAVLFGPALVALAIWLA
jgi:hypothetical protein